MARKTFDAEVAMLAKKWDWVIGKAEMTIQTTKGPISKDLFGFIDWVAISYQNIIGLQITSRDNMAARLLKIHDEKRLLAAKWLIAGGLLYVVGFQREDETARVIELHWDGMQLIDCEPIIWTYEDL